MVQMLQEYSNLLLVVITAVYASITFWMVLEMKKSREQDVQTRLEEIKNRRAAVLHTLSTEIKDNLMLSDGNYRIQQTYVRFLDDAYEQAKRQPGSVPPDLIEPLRTAYSEARRFNALADYCQVKASPGDKYFNEQANKVKEKFETLSGSGFES